MTMIFVKRSLEGKYEISYEVLRGLGEESGILKHP